LEARCNLNEIVSKSFGSKEATANATGFIEIEIESEIEENVAR